MISISRRHAFLILFHSVIALVSCNWVKEGDENTILRRSQKINQILTEAGSTMDLLKIRSIDILQHIDKYQDGLYASSRYAFFRDTVFYTPEDDGYCEAWASGLYPIEESAFSKIKALEYLCPDLVRIHHENPLFAAIYISTRDSIVLMYPYGDANTYLKPKMDVSTAWVTYWKANETHNPERRTLWVEPYLDALGRGYMVSIIAPVYVGNRLEATLGIDITCDSLRDRFLIDSGRNLMFITERGLVVAVNEPCATLLNIKGPGKYDYLEKAYENQPIPEKYNLLKNPQENVRELASKLLSSDAAFTMQINDGRYVVGKAPLAEVNWYLVELERI